MCKFDKDPIWRMPATSIGPDFLENQYPKSTWEVAGFDNELNQTIFKFPEDQLHEHYFPKEECTGEFHFYYYTLLFMSHTYFLIEFLMRTLSSKEVSLFLGELDSMIEIFTTVPFFLLWSIFGN